MKIILSQISFFMSQKILFQIKAETLLFGMSDGTTFSESFLALAALMFLIVATADAKGDQATAHPAAEQADDQTRDPGHHASR